MSGRREAYEPRKPAPPLGENDYALLDYLIARAIDACIAEQRKART